MVLEQANEPCVIVREGHGDHQDRLAVSNPTCDHTRDPREAILIQPGLFLHARRSVGTGLVRSKGLVLGGMATLGESADEGADLLEHALLRFLAQLGQILLEAAVLPRRKERIDRPGHDRAGSGEGSSQVGQGGIVHSLPPKLAVLEVQHEEPFTQLLPPVLEPEIGLLVGPGFGI